MNIAVDVGVISAVQDWFKIHIKASGIHSDVANDNNSFAFYVSNASFARISAVNKHHSGCTAATALSTKTGNWIRMVTVGASLFSK